MKAGLNKQMHTILHVKHGIGKVYVTVDFIRIGWFKLRATRRKRKYKIKNSCPQRDSNPLHIAY